MSKVTSIAITVLIVGLIYWTGVMSKLNLSHPFWETKATLVGAAIGLVLAFGIVALRGRAGCFVNGVLFAALLLSFAVTWRAARFFINSPDYEPLAGQIWFFGYHAFVATLVAVLATMLPRFFPKR